MAINIVVPDVREVTQQVEDLADERRIERARDLVEQEQRRSHRERSHDGDALLLSAGESVGVVVGAVLETDALEELQRLVDDVARVCVSGRAPVPRGRSRAP